MGLKQILPIAAGAAILAASGGTAAPALAAAAEGAGAAGAAGAGAGGLLGAASGMTGTALGTGAGLLGTGAATAAESIPSVLEGSGLVGSTAGGLADIATTATPSAINTLNSATLAEGTTGLGGSLIPTMDLANSTVVNPLSAWDKVSNFADKYGTVQNVTGAGNLAMKYADMNKPRPMQSSGQVSRGQAPTMEALMALQKMGYQLPQNKKINFSLIG